MESKPQDILREIDCANLEAENNRLRDAIKKAMQKLEFVSGYMGAKSGWQTTPNKPDSKSHRNYEMLREPYWILEEALIDEAHEAKGKP